LKKQGNGLNERVTDDTQLFTSSYYDFISFYLVLGVFHGQRRRILEGIYTQIVEDQKAK
jgi:hypothetical protein